ncbi:hypothetical protein V2J09_022993 [Rumex salicifolius]
MYFKKAFELQVWIHFSNGLFLEIALQLRRSRPFFVYDTRRKLSKKPTKGKSKGNNDAIGRCRFKLTPYISKKVFKSDKCTDSKTKPCLLCKALEVKYFQGKNYLEVNSTCIVFYNVLENQANTEEELPECLMGTCRLNHVDVAKAVDLRP